MILSNIEIQKAIDEGRLVINPEPTPRKPEIGKHCPYDTHSVDLRLHYEITIPESGPFNYNLQEAGSLSKLIADNSRKLTLTKDQPYQLPPGKFILARTIERIELAVKPNQICLAARIEGKSSRARCGILVHFTAPTVHPGFKGSLTLEMINLGPATFTLTPEMPIAQLIVEEVKGEVMLNPSQFQDQSTPEGTS